jgi:hypothetical protein
VLTREKEVLDRGLVVDYCDVKEGDPSVFPAAGWMEKRTINKETQAKILEDNANNLWLRTERIY